MASSAVVRFEESFVMIIPKELRQKTPEQRCDLITIFFK